MKQDGKKRKIKKRKPRLKFSYVIVLIVTLYFISRMPPFLKASAQTTYAAEHGKIEKSIEAEGYVAREEKVFTSIRNGDVKYFVSEGEKVAKGQKLAEVYLDTLDEQSKKDLEIINFRLQNIKDKQGEQTSFQGDSQKLDQQVSTLINSIQKDLKDQKYDKIASMKEELTILLDKKSIIVGEKSFSGKNEAQLERQKSQLEDKVNSAVQTIYSDSPGFVAMGSDGFEDLLNYKTLSEVKSSQLEMLEETNKKKSSKEIKEEGTPIVRIIKSYKWSIIVELDEKDTEGMEVGKSLKLRPDNSTRELSGIIRNITEDDKKSIVIFDMVEFYDNFYNLRTITIEAVQSRSEGVMVANSSIVEKDGIKGVYTVDVNGITKFMQIKIKASNQEYSIVHNGYFEVKKADDPEKTEKINTINLYDEVVLHGAKVKEGERVK